jgi:hypothetical protein
MQVRGPGAGERSRDRPIARSSRLLSSSGRRLEGATIVFDVMQAYISGVHAIIGRLDLPASRRVSGPL